MRKILVLLSKAVFLPPFLVFTQNGEMCTDDASVAHFSGAVRTCNSEQNFHEPFVPGGHMYDCGKEGFHAHFALFFGLRPPRR